MCLFCLRKLDFSRLPSSVFDCKPMISCFPIFHGTVALMFGPISEQAISCTAQPGKDQSPRPADLVARWVCGHERCKSNPGKIGTTKGEEAGRPAPVQPGQFNRKGMAYDRTNESWGLAHGNAKVEDTSSSQLSLN